MDTNLVLSEKHDVVLKTIESELLKHSQDFDASVYHRFGPGIYIREMHIPAGVVGMGHKQKHQHMNVFLSGKIRLLNEDGSFNELTAPMTFVGQSGRKVVHVIEAMIWQNIYATDETDVEKLEEMYLDKSPESVEYYKAKKEEIELLNYVREDFLKVLKEFNLTEQYVHEQSLRCDDLIDMPYEYCSVCVRSSNIDGKGFFASAPIKKGEIIAPAVFKGKRTPASRYMNHSPDANAKAVIKPNGDIYFIAISDISGCKSGDDGQEITTDYRESIKYRMERKLCLDG